MQNAEVVRPGDIYKYNYEGKNFTEDSRVKWAYLARYQKEHDAWEYDEEKDGVLRVQNEIPKEVTVYTGGTFDMFHKGHVDLLKVCATLGRVVVALNTDEFVEKYKGKKPIMSYQERLDVISSCRYVSKVIKNFGEEDSRSTILAVQPKPDFIAIGSDWLEKDYLKQMNIDTKFLEENEIMLIYIPRPADENRISSTEIKRRVKDEA